MAALLIRTLFYPKDNSGRGRYNIVRSKSSSIDEERGSSVDSGVVMCEKPSKDNTHLLPARINPRLISDATIGLSDGLVCTVDTLSA